MTPERWQRVIEVTDEALKRPDPSQRRLYLDEACRQEPDVREEAEKLLLYENMETPVLDGLVKPLAQPPLRPGVNISYQMLAYPRPDRKTFGPFQLERVLGRGGMGTVYLTVDHELERPIALKILRNEKVSDDLLRRFEQERRLLARLDHPNIARIYGGGDVDGVPYFTMELFAGRPINDFCAAWVCTLRERVELLLPIADALAHAHKNLIVHRDIKPANVLVNDDFESKLVDFGIAKELEGNEPAAIAQTATGQHAMTLAWASPEQVRQLPLTTATDVYSFGVLTYELLTGHPPYDLDGDFLENARRICEEEVMPPSARVWVTREVWEDGDSFLIDPEEVAERRRETPKSLSKALAGDLGAVILKTLNKDPDERYGSMAELREDLRRWLDGKPVSARRQTWWRRTVALTRRHRWRLVATTLLLTTLITLGVFRWRDAQKVQRLSDERAAAALAEEEAIAQADVMRRVVRNLLRSPAPDAEGHVRADLANDPENLAHALEAIGLSHQGHARWDDGRRLLTESLLLRRRFYGDHPLTARSLNNLGALEHQAGDLMVAEKLYRLALAMRERLGQDESELLKVESNIASILTQRGAFDEAEALYRRILTARQRLYGPKSRDTATSLRSLGVLLYVRGDAAEAEPLLREALEIRREVHGERHPRTAAALSSLGKALLTLERYDESVISLNKALEIRWQLWGSNHVLVAASRRDLALLYFALNEDEIAQVLWSRALSTLRKRDLQRGTLSWEVADAESRLGALLLKEGRVDEAAVCLRDSWEALQRLRGEEAAITREAESRFQLLRR